MITCSNCGQRNLNYARICTECGTVLNTEQNEVDQVESGGETPQSNEEIGSSKDLLDEGGPVERLEPADAKQTMADGPSESREAGRFPMDELEHHVFSREPLQEGEIILVANSTSFFRMWSSGILLTNKSFIEWSKKKIGRIKIDKISNIELIEVGDLAIGSYAFKFQYKGKKKKLVFEKDEKKIKNLLMVLNENDIEIPSGFFPEGADPESAGSYFLNTQPRTKKDFMNEVNTVADNSMSLRCMRFEARIPELGRIPTLPAVPTGLSVYISNNHFYLYGKNPKLAARAVEETGGLIGPIGGLLGPVMGGTVSTFVGENEIILKVPWSDVIWVKADKSNRRVIILAKANGKKFLIPLTKSGQGPTINKMIDLLEKYVDVETTEMGPYSDITL